jgi:uncharacterized protein (TIGR03437 family)
LVFREVQRMKRPALWVLVSYLAFCPHAIAQGGIITTVAGNGNGGLAGEGGPATSASLTAPVGVAVDAAGNIFIADTGNERIRRVSGSGIITTVAGGGFSGDGGPATSAALGPTAVAVDSSGNLFIADGGNNRIRKVSASGIITTVAGTGARGFSGDGGPATSETLSLVCCGGAVALDSSGNLFIADGGNNRIRKVSASGIITTVAGNGKGGFSGDGGLATSASLSLPIGVAVDANGNIFVADWGNNRIRKVSASGVITTVAGNGALSPPYLGAGTFSGDGGPATAAGLNRPNGIAADASGELFIADSGNERIREVSASGIISTVAGNGSLSFSGDGAAATSASLNLYGGGAVAVDASGNFFIADTGNNRIREVSRLAASPSVPATGVADGAGFSARISGGGIGSIFGTNLAATTMSASSVPLPTTLGGGTVSMNGISVPLFFVSPLQINFQVPWQLLSSQVATLAVTTSGGTSPPVPVTLYSASPGIFTIKTTNSSIQGAIQFANSPTLVAPVGAITGAVSHPATTGDILTIYCSGLGAVTNSPVSGSVAGSGTDVSTVLAQVSVTIGGQSAPVLFAGLAPGFVGLYQVNVQFPAGVASGSVVPVILTTVNLSSNAATIAVQ